MVAGIVAMELLLCKYVCRRRKVFESSLPEPDHVREEERGSCKSCQFFQVIYNRQSHRELDRVSRGIKQTICFAE